MISEDLYVAQTQQGNGDGLSSANAKAITFFNSSGNWGSGAGKISAGDTVHFVSTITTAAAVQASGTSGNYITLLFESGSKFSSSAWASSGAINGGQHDYIIVDGGSNGIIENTDNGANLGSKVDSTMVDFTSANHCIVKNLLIRNVYVRTRGTDQNDYGSGVRNKATGTVKGFTDFRVNSCTITEAYIGINLTYGTDGVTNVEVDHNEAYNCNWGGRLSDDASGATADSVTIHDNYFHDWTNWDDTSSNNFHHNGFYCWAESGGTLLAITEYNNILGPNYSIGSPNHSTSGLFLSGGITGPVLIYNNLFLEGVGDGPADGLITILPYGSASATLRVYSNTFYGNGGNTGTDGIGVDLSFEGGTGGVGTSIDLKDNLCQGVATFISRFSKGSSVMTADYNLGYNLQAGQEYSDSSNGSSDFKTFSQWKALGYDAHGLNSNPTLSVSYIPQTGSPAINSAISLSSYFTVDKNGVSRGLTWDIGAFESSSYYSSSSVSGNFGFRGSGTLK